MNYLVINMKKILITILLLFTFTLVACDRDYKVTFKLYDDVKESQIVRAHDTIENFTPKRTGYTFSCWLYEDEVFDVDTKIEKNITLTAEWILNDYYVNFYNEGELVKTSKVEYGRLVEEVKLEKEDYIFLGWYTTDHKFDFNTRIEKDLDLNARWVKDSEYKIDITISFNSTGAKIKYDEIVVKRMDEIPTLPSPTFEGHEFLGWYLGDKKISEGDILRELEDFCLIAKWK